MRHGKTVNHLGRTSSHRKALLSNMASSLILHKRIETTVAKAKALRKYVEPLLTKSKTDTTHNRRTAFSYLKDKETLKELFGTVADKVANRPGGYTRIIKLPNRLGDNASMCVIELVDFNETLLAAKPAAEATTATRRSRRGGGSGTKSTTATAAVDRAEEASAPAEEEAPASTSSYEASEDAPEQESSAATAEAVADEANGETENGDAPAEGADTEEEKA